MEKVVKDKTVVVTGGAAGIGYEIAEHFLKNEAKIVIILDVNDKNGEKAAAKFNETYGENKAVFINCDVTTDLEKVAKKLFDEYKTIDVLVNNAGVFDEIEMKLMIGINFTAVVEWTFKFWEHMRKDKGGKGGTILNMSSLYGFQVVPYVPVYQGTKFAVFGFSKSLGHKKTYEKTGVRIIAICPGYTKTKTDEFLDENAQKLVIEGYSEYLASLACQPAAVVGAATVEMFRRADSGTAWLIDDSQPISEVVLKRI